MLAKKLCVLVPVFTLLDGSIVLSNRVNTEKEQKMFFIYFPVFKQKEYI